TVSTSTNVKRYFGEKLITHPPPVLLLTLSGLIFGHCLFWPLSSCIYPLVIFPFAVLYQTTFYVLAVWHVSSLSEWMERRFDGMEWVQHMIGRVWVIWLHLFGLHHR